MYQRELTLPVKHSFFLFGPRQTGKSTLLKHRFLDETTIYYDLLQSSEYLRLKASPSLFREEVLSRAPHVTRIIVDEIQRLPILLNEVQALMADAPGLQFCLTGSSARKLKTDEGNLLAGRALTYHLHPLTVRELPDTLSLIDLLRFGSLPPVINAEPALRGKILQSYVDTYLHEEIEREAQLKKMDSFIHFLRMAADENGHTLNFSNIGREAAVSPKTIQSYFGLLLQTFIGVFLYPYMKSRRKRLSKHPKFYFGDTGLVRALQGKINADLLPKTQDYGDAFEHLVILEILRLNDYAAKDFRFAYYRTERGAEVDLVIETPDGQLLAIEIKAREQITATHLRGLKAFAIEFPHAQLYCATTAPRPITRGSVQILPWRDLLERLSDL